MAAAPAQSRSWTRAKRRRVPHEIVGLIEGADQREHGVVRKIESPRRDDGGKEI